MADSQPKLGTIAWVDLTVADAPKIRDFYKKVIGWNPSPVKMGDYDDYNMVSPATEKPAAGICHARGENEGLRDHHSINPPRLCSVAGLLELAAWRKKPSGVGHRRS